MSPKLCIKYFSKPIYDLKTCSKMKKLSFSISACSKLPKKVKKVEIGFITPFDHCALILYSVTPSDMNFQTILMPKVILAIFFVTKNLLTWTILISSML